MWLLICKLCNVTIMYKQSKFGLICKRFNENPRSRENSPYCTSTLVPKLSKSLFWRHLDIRCPSNYLDISYVQVVYKDVRHSDNSGTDIRVFWRRFCSIVVVLVQNCNSQEVCYTYIWGLFSVVKQELCLLD